MKKLIRNKLAHIINAREPENISVPDVGVDLRNLLNNKLYEEAGEYVLAENRIQRLQELADVLQVVESLAEFDKSSLKEIEDIARAKRITHGDFSQYYLLEIQ